MDDRPWRAVVDRGELAIVLLRHGRTSWNAERRFLGVTDIPLDAVGLEQAREVAHAYRAEFSCVYSSPLARARQTAATIAPDPLIIDDFGELRQGELEGMRGEEAMSRYPDFFATWAHDPGQARVPGGESLGECLVRARRGVDRLCHDHAPGQAILVVTHQMVMASLTCHASHVPLSKWRGFCVDNTAGTVFSWDGLALRVEISGWRPSSLNG